MIKQIDPLTKEEFFPLRKNQVFASAKNRISFHNANAADFRRIKSPIDKALEKNFIILSELLQKGETKEVLKDDLLLKGFNPLYFTHLINHNGKTCRCLYHFIIPQSENPNFLTFIYP